MVLSMAAELFDSPLASVIVPYFSNVIKYFRKCQTAIKLLRSVVRLPCLTETKIFSCGSDAKDLKCLFMVPGTVVWKVVPRCKNEPYKWKLGSTEMIGMVWGLPNVSIAFHSTPFYWFWKKHPQTKIKHKQSKIIYSNWNIYYLKKKFFFFLQCVTPIGTLNVKLAFARLMANNKRE